MNNWKECKLGEVAEVQNGYAFKSKDFSDISGLPVIKIKNVASGKLQMDNLNYYDFPIDKLSRFVIRKNDILIAMTGSHVNQPSSMVGKVARYNLDTIALLNQRVGKVYSIDNNMLDEDFLYYFLTQHDVTYELALNAGGSANQANISSKLIKTLDIYIPPILEQKAIASILSNLDNKVALLHRQNKTLEAMIETLFRQWFVEEPEGNWEVKSLDQVASYLNGLACQKYPPKTEGNKLPVLKIKELKSGFTENSDWATEEVPKEYIVSNGDIIFAWSGSLVVKIWDGDKCVLNQHLFKVTSEDYPKWFYYLWTKHHLEKFISIAESKATTMGHIKRGDLSASFVLIPSKNQLENMDKIMTPIINKVIVNNEQIQKLQLLRETLKKDLISGEVRVEYDKYRGHD